ncbi:tetratricopeptide repeat protein [Reichenbachiella carrageenanivorans]|uniref:Tetratricopeptide repeat protein n=1 Tax=Reichenbachiella carrageenanivorans TaxID=2979869 RepID=A0ABY6D048_9BACT|nr:histidine kinase dimerization/phosphoacceptor domain -containing protein [Reichenbachiella carrageenanivorans]UXX79540.1 tetratricopeptide repeat protein [Reichenbachiella carrageenanivorans]
MTKLQYIFTVLLFLLTSTYSFSTSNLNDLDSLRQQLKTEQNEDKIYVIHETLAYTYMLIGTHDSSLLYYQKSLDYHRAQKNKKKEADILVSIGETYRNNDVPDRAMDFFIQGIKIYEALNLHGQVASTYNSMADLVMRQNDYTKAKEYMAMVQQILHHTSYPSALAHSFMNQGRIFNSMLQFDSAVYYHQKAIDLFDSLGMYHDKGRAMHNQANSLRELKRFDEALDICQQVLLIPELKANIKSQIFTILLIANIYMDTDRPRQAIKYGIEGLELAKKYGFLDRERVAYKYLSQTYDKMGDYKAAFKYHQQFTTLMEAIFDKDKYEQVNRMNALYESEKKEQTIAIHEANLEAREATIALQQSRQSQLYFGIGFAIFIGLVLAISYVGQTKSNKLLHQQKLEIEKQNSERETLLKEIHHRVKNNLQVISSLLSMQSRQMEDGEAKTAVREGQSRIKSMSLIHQKLYSEDNLSRINMKEYIEDLSSFLFKSYKPSKSVSQLIEADEVMLDVDTAVPLGLIINELISNALKYAFEPEQKGEISIRLNHEDNGYVLHIADTGKGLPQNFDQKQSMGMKLVTILVDQIDGLMKIDNSLGTFFTIKFKDKRAA